MSKIEWVFETLGRGLQYGNVDVAGFKGRGLLESVAREICQNSLDAKNDKSDDPVRIVFRLKYLRINDFPALKDYRKCVESCKRFWQDRNNEKILKHLDKVSEVLSKEQIPMFVASDYNTRGLEKDSTWVSLTSGDGINYKTTSEPAGMHGVGKNAPFAASSLSMVFYNTRAIDGWNAFAGIAKLAALYNENGEATQKDGQYKNNIDHNTLDPIFENDECALRDEFARTEYGTDVIVAGFNKVDGWDKKIAKAIVRNFYVAIIEQKLVVEIEDNNKTSLIINKDTINECAEKYIKGTRQYQGYLAYTMPDVKEPLSIKWCDSKEENNAIIYYKQDKEYGKSITYFRNNGMRIVWGDIKLIQRFAAVVVVKGQLSKLLALTETQKHDKWDPEQIDDEQTKNEAENALESLNKEVLSFLKEQCCFDIGEEHDPAGASDMLPDNMDENVVDNNANGDDILKPKITLRKDSRLKRKTHCDDETGLEGTLGRGRKKYPDFPPHPGPTPPHPHPPRPLPPVEYEDEDGENGIVRVSGRNHVEVNPKFSIFRAFAISPKSGLYRIVLQADDNYKKIYMSAMAVGEDGKSSKINILQLRNNKTAYSIKNGSAWPIDIIKGEILILTMQIGIKDKLELDFRFTPEEI